MDPCLEIRQIAAALNKVRELAVTKIQFLACQKPEMKSSPCICDDFIERNRFYTAFYKQLLGVNILQFSIYAADVSPK